MFNKIFRDRYSVLSFFTIIMIIIITHRMFTLQIANGVYYRSEAEKKLMRINTIKAPRGEILDAYGSVLANNIPGFSVEIVKAKVEDDAINHSLQEIIKILEKNQEAYKDNLPISLPFEFIFNSKSEEEAWKNKYKIASNATPKEAFYKLREKYKISPKLKDSDARKLITLRYEMSEQGYSLFKTVTLAMDVNQKTVSEIEERHLEFPGVNIAVNPIRNYPNGELASHILGYIGSINQQELDDLGELGYNNNDIIGKYGIEKTSEVKLKGTNGKKFVETDLSGRFSKSIENLDSVQGATVTLTIDKEIQKIAEQSLKDTINKIKTGGFGKTYKDVAGGAAIAVNVNTGEILALANYPNFNPATFAKGITLKDWNKINKDPLRPMFNRAISGKYAPGSTFKMITGIAALEEGVTTTSEEILDTGKYKYFKDYQPACWIYTQNHGTHGYVNISEALKVSCNIYFYEVGRRLGSEKMSNYATKFGLNSKTGIELGGEVTGAIASPANRLKMYESNPIAFPNKTWHPGDTIQTAIGQSDSLVTPIGMAQYISTLANGGTRYQLHLIKSIVSNNGKNSYLSNSAKSIDKINIEQNNLNAVLEGMRSVTSDTTGTAYSYFKDFPSNINISGKTGTSQTLIGKKSPHAWFVGFAGLADKTPEIAVVVLIENGGSGGYAAPIASDIFSQYFGLSKEVKLDESIIQTNDELEQIEEQILSLE